MLNIPGATSFRIAVSGAECRIPAGAHHPELYWSDPDAAADGTAAYYIPLQTADDKERRSCCSTSQ